MLHPLMNLFSKCLVKGPRVCLGFFYIYNFIYLFYFLAVLGLHCFVWAFL